MTLVVVHVARESLHCCFKCPHLHYPEAFADIVSSTLIQFVSRRFAPAHQAVSFRIIHFRAE